MARLRARPAPLAAPPAPAGWSAARSPHTTQAATDLAQLLRARAFAVAGSGPAVARVLSNLESAGGPARLDDSAVAWIGLGTPPEGRLGISLGDAAGVLGPHSFGFLNNLDDVAPLAAPLPVGERPRKGGVAVVVPRRDALPEMVPLLFNRGLGISWLISVGDGDPAEVLRFLRLDPGTRAVLCAFGRGARAQTLHEALVPGDKPLVLLEPPGLVGTRDPVLLRAVSRRAGAALTQSLEDWLAHGALLDAVTGAGGLGSWRSSPPPAPSRGRGRGRAVERRARAAVVVLGAGADLVTSEVLPLRQRARILSPVVVDGEDPAASALIDQALRDAAAAAEIVVLCGPPELSAELRAPGPLLRVDPAQPERLRAVLRALAAEVPRFGAETDEEAPDESQRPIPIRAERARVEGVLADLPPLLYVGDAAVSDEILGDHDLKRLLHAYGARVTRQAPASTATAALRILQKLELPVQVVPAVTPLADGPAVLAAEAREAVVCATQAEVKRHTTLLLSKSAYVLLREAVPASPRVRLLVSPERGLGAVLRVTPGATDPAPLQPEAALLPLWRFEARELADVVAAAYRLGDGARDALVALLAQISACATAHELTLDVQVFLSDEPLVAHAAGVLKREVKRRR